MSMQRSYNTKLKNREWKKVKIKDFGIVSTGNTPSTKNKEYYGGEYKLISPADLTDSKYITTSHKLITEKGLKVSRTLPKNAVLVGCIGNIGKIGITIDEMSAFNQQINAIVCNENFNSDFIYYLLRYNRPLLESKAAKVTLPILNKTNFENIELESPALSEQKEIARVLNNAQDAIAGQEELIEKLKKLKKSMMQHLFTHGTKNEPTKMTEIGGIPESWEIQELGQVFKFSSGKTRPTDTDKIKSDAKQIPVYGGNGILGYSSSNLFDEKKLIIGRVGEYCGCVHITEIKSWISDNALYSKETLQKANLLFYKYLLEFWNLNRFSNKMGQPLVTQGILSKVFIPNVKINDQDDIAESIFSIDQKIESAQAKLSTYQKLFKTLLHELMSGERRINYGK